MIPSAMTGTVTRTDAITVADSTIGSWTVAKGVTDMSPETATATSLRNTVKTIVQKETDHGPRAQSTTTIETATGRRQRVGVKLTKRYPTTRMRISDPIISSINDVG